MDFVVICYQEVSNTGRVKPFEWSHQYNEKYKFIKYETRQGISPKENERRKHQFMMDYAHQLGCTHAIMAATDHFYHRSQLDKAKEKAIKYDVTFTAMYTYFKNPTWQLTPIEDYFMPFICKLPCKIINQVKYPLIVDPSCRVAFKTWYLFGVHEVMLHHYSLVRKDLKEKFLNSASGKRVTDRMSEFMDEVEHYDIDINPGVKYFNGRKIKVVPNYFNL